MESRESDHCYFIADDAAGGFFAINGGAFGSDLHKIYYWPPDSMEWESTDLGFTEFFCWSLTGDLEEFYSSARWSNWKHDVSTITGDECFDFYPPLWTKEGSAEKSHRCAVPIEEAFAAKLDFLRQLSWSSLESARKFFESPETVERRRRAGVKAPNFVYLEELEHGTR